MSNKHYNSCNIPDLSAGNDPGASALAFIPFFPTGQINIPSYREQYGGNELPRPRGSMLSKCFI